MPPKNKKTTAAETEKVEKPKKAKATKAKGKSKKPLTGYMLFAKEMRPVVKEENPEFSFGELGKELGARWRALTDDEKEAYKTKK
ncbi:hypothetical protein QTG54_015680 [Skeletonema marinoi]|uniref:HMG box domain-containing protein n=1 Tax=Skeletonema marinoi TaxID=267567 RepID=A0AAD8XTW3_9STRA|nr:hypothetical protein QTG54_015680 [Skeletonema marinoi]